MTLRADGALVLFSGGQDSTTCLAWALERFARVETIGFDYNQRHRIELDCRKSICDGLAALNPLWAARLGEDHTIGLGVRRNLEYRPDARQRDRNRRERAADDLRARAQSDLSDLRRRNGLSPRLAAHRRRHVRD